jgi:hypothetical protein
LGRSLPTLKVYPLIADPSNACGFGSISIYERDSLDVRREMCIEADEHFHKLSAA